MEIFHIVVIGSLALAILLVAKNIYRLFLLSTKTFVYEWRIHYSAHTIAEALYKNIQMDKKTTLGTQAEELAHEQIWLVEIYTIIFRDLLIYPSLRDDPTYVKKIIDLAETLLLNTIADHPTYSNFDLLRPRVISRLYAARNWIISNLTTEQAKGL